jgi:maltooligosyltrehalose trehalohydrolase
MKTLEEKIIPVEATDNLIQPWSGSWGPRLDKNGCLFRIWARPDARLELILEGEGSTSARVIPMQPQPDGMFAAYIEGAGAGSRYWFRIDGNGPFPDPASRFQPQGVHRSSQVVPSYSYPAETFRQPALRDLVIYELHVGTFTPVGTFRAAIEKLGDLRELGITAIELMAIAEFAGNRNWGYDGVSLYAPEHTYGTPGDLRKLVRAAHQQGIAVLLDVVYNHLGPDGAYHSTFAPQFYSGRHKTPWGDGLNYDGPGKEKVRAYFIESALMWLHDYHVDGFRCDATDTIQDDSRPHFLTELTERIHAEAEALGRKTILIAEDARNERRVVLPPAQAGYGFDAVWADDFHHEIRHRLAGDSDGYYRDFSGSTTDIATTIQNGWFFTGQFAKHWEHARGTDPAGLSRESRVFCIQNHDQIGNRAFGDRLSTQVSRAAYYAASALLLLSPEVPLIFMGQEWAASEPFLFFTNHHDELGRMVTEGRRKEFEKFAAFSDEARRDSIPDPQARKTFLKSKLNWRQRNSAQGAACLRWYQDLLRIRKNLLGTARFRSSSALNDRTIALQWESANNAWVAIVALEGPPDVSGTSFKEMKIVLSSEDPRYSLDSQPAFWEPKEGKLYLQRAGAVLLVNREFALKPGNRNE